MAVGPRQTNSNARYDPNQDFTLDQLRRFGQVANHAQIIRESERERSEHGPKASKVRKAFKPVIQVKNAKHQKSLRYAVWLSLALIMLLWFMYMTG